MIKKEYILISYGEFEEIVKNTFGQDYEYTVDENEEVINYTSRPYNVGNCGLSKHKQEQLDKFIKTGEYKYLAQTLLTELYNRDILEAGEYLIQNI